MTILINTREQFQEVLPPDTTLGSALPYVILSGTTITNGVHDQLVTGNVGYVTSTTDTFTFVSGVPVTNATLGTINTPNTPMGDAHALYAAANRYTPTFAYATGAVDLATNVTSPDGTGVFKTGIYKIAGACNIGAAGITLTGLGTFVFIIMGPLTSTPASVVTLANGADAANVYFIVGGTVNLAASTTFVGSVLSRANPIVTGANFNLSGRLISEVGVTIGGGTNTFTVPLVTGGAGTSGYSGFSGKSGYSGYSGISGYSGFTGAAGSAGTSGFSGFSGQSGFSGFSGYSGYTGASGFTGISGYSGFSGRSGYSGYSGPSGYSGFSGTGGSTGTSGFSGFSGTGTSGYSGYSGVGGAGTSGFSGFSGVGGAGTSGFSGFSGTSGYSGFTGVAGSIGTSGFSGFSGYSGFSGVSGFSGIPLTSALGTADLAIANTETVVVSRTFAANELTAGMTFKFEAYSTRAGTTTAQEIIRIRVGTTALTGNIAATLTPPTSTLAVGSKIEGLVTIRTAGAGGTVQGMLQRTTHLAAVTITSAISAFTTPVAVNTTTANQIVALTFISGNAANTWTFRNVVLYRVN